MKVMKAFILVIAIILIVACDNIDCSYMNTVYTTYQIKQGEEKIDTLKDTLSISTKRRNGTDSLVLNKAVGATAFDLPISYVNLKDTFVFYRKGERVIFDTVVIEKTNIPHFESVDCSPKYFHEIIDVAYTQNGIERIDVKNTQVTYEPKDHFYIYFKH